MPVLLLLVLYVAPNHLSTYFEQTKSEGHMCTRRQCLSLLTFYLHVARDKTEVSGTCLFPHCLLTMKTHERAASLALAGTVIVEFTPVTSFFVFILLNWRLAQLHVFVIQYSQV
jgi:hypothetical protein